MATGVIIVLRMSGIFPASSWCRMLRRRRRRVVRGCRELLGGLPGRRGYLEDVQRCSYGELIDWVGISERGRKATHHTFGCGGGVLVLKGGAC